MSNEKDIFDETANDDDIDVITLFNEDTQADEDFYVLASLEYNEEWFIMLTPVEPTPDIGDDECLIYQIGTDENGDDTLLVIEDEKLLDAVYQQYLAEMAALDDVSDDSDEDND